MVNQITLGSSKYLSLELWVHMHESVHCPRKNSIKRHVQPIYLSSLVFIYTSILLTTKYINITIKQVIQLSIDNDSGKFKGNVNKLWWKTWMLIYNKEKIFNALAYLGSLTRVGIEVGGDLAPECLCILDRYYVFREAVKTLWASESKGELTCGQSSFW